LPEIICNIIVPPSVQIELDAGMAKGLDLPRFDGETSACTIVFSLLRK
jgi:hypothetical protein